MPRVYSLQEQARFYLERVGGRHNRQWWQTMNPDRMLQIVNTFLDSDNVTEETKKKYEDIQLELIRVIMKNRSKTEK